MLKSRSLRLVLAAAALLLLLFAAWSAWVGWNVYRDLDNAVARASAIQDAVRDGDRDRIDAELSDLQATSADAVDGTSGVTWRVLSVFPFFGDDVEAIEVTSQVIDDLANGGIEPLVAVSDRLDELLPRDGAVDLEAVAGLEPPISDAQAAFAEAHAALEKLDGDYLGRLDRELDRFESQVDQADRAMTVASTAVRLLPGMLGQDGPRTFLIGFQNNAEIRATGGLIGAVAEVQTDNGALAITRQISGGKVAHHVPSPLAITPAERKLYRRAIGSFFVNSGMTPDVPRAAAYMKAHWETTYPAAEVDGVILVDTVAMAYLLDATGPIDVDGVALTGATLVDELLHNTYLRLQGDGEAQDKFFADVASATFERLTGELGDGEAVVEALAKATGEGRLLLHSFDQEEQAELAGTQVAGEFVTAADVEEPRIAITLNDSTGSKMSYYLRTEVNINATYCTSGTQGYTAKMRLISTAPPDAEDLPADITGGGNYGVAPGRQLVTVRMFAPAGGSIGEFKLNSEVSGLVRLDQDGRPAGMTYIQLDPGQTVDIAWTMKSGEGQTGDAIVAITPTLETDDTIKSVRSAC